MLEISRIFDPQVKLLQHFPAFVLKKFKPFVSICIIFIRWKRHSDPPYLKRSKISLTRKWKNSSILRKWRRWLIAESFLGSHNLKTIIIFVLIYIVFIRRRLDSAPPYLKTLEKFVIPSHENNTTFCKKHVYDSWKCEFLTFILKKIKAFALVCNIFITKVETGQRSTILKNLENFGGPANENYKTFCKITYMGHGGKCFRLYYERSWKLLL